MNSNEVKQALQKSITQFINAYKTINSLSTSWKLPIVGFADTDTAYILSLREIVSPTHYMPQDFLSDCTVIISYFLPFDTEIGQSNNGNTEPSPTWVTAYNETNQMFLEINKHLIQLIGRWGFHAVSPQTVGMIDSTHIYSNWSQRHIAYAAGLGTFGVNNMLITEAGTCGRFYSLITDLPVEPDYPLKEERCLYKRSGVCGLCVRRCPIQALALEKPFDRNACASRLEGFERRLGADVCGKCTVKLPCTYHNPAKGL